MTKTDPLLERKRGRPSKSQKDGSLKVALIRAALTIFGEKGFDGASLSQIAKKAGTDIALTRYYFGSKMDLWTSAIEYLIAELAMELDDLFVATSAKPTERLKVVIRWFVNLSALHPYLSRIIVLDGALEDERGQYIANNLVGPFYVFLANIIEDAKNEGSIPNVETRTIFFMITHGGSFPMSMPALTNAFPGGDIRSKKSLEKHSEAIINLIVRE